MARTIKRQPFTVSTSSNAYPKPQTLIQAEFKGLSDVKNDVLADQMSFASTENIYVDDNMLLVSRPPFKFYDREARIIKQWSFGPYRLRLYRSKLNDEFKYTLRCISHTTSVPEGSTDKFTEKEWTIPNTEVDVTCVQIEDKIFVWFGGFDLVVFNTAKLYFESGIQYLYLPVLSLVVNGIETSLESENFLTPTGRKRYQYSALSSVDFESLFGKSVRVNLSGAMTEGSSQYLYTTNIGQNQKKVLVYPYSSVGNISNIDVKEGLSTRVFLRYFEPYSTIEISFDGRYFQSLPYLDDIVGLPQLTDDATHVVAFTTDGIAWCKLFADASEESAYDFSFVWNIKRYAMATDRYGIADGFVPIGHFASETQFAYVYMPENGAYPVLCAEWPDSTSGQSTGTKTMVSYDSEDPIVLITNDDIKVGECYIAPIDGNAGLLVSILNAKGTDGKPNIISCIFRDGQDTELVQSALKTDINNLVISCRQCDIQVKATSLSTYRTFAAMNTNIGDYVHCIDWQEDDGTLTPIVNYEPLTGKSSTQLRINDSNILTDKYLHWYEGTGVRLYGSQQTNLPTIDFSVTNKAITNNDNIVLGSYFGNVHCVAKDSGEIPKYWYLSANEIVSGSLVAWKKNARTAAEYLLPNVIDESSETAAEGTLFYIERVSPVSGGWQVHTGDNIHVGDIVRLRAYPNSYGFDVSLPGNPLGETLTVSPWEYPASGDVAWATLPKPWIPTGDGTYREWEEGKDALPTGPVMFYGKVGINQEILPLYSNENGIWLNISGTLWTSELSTDNVLELDEYINQTGSQGIDTRLYVPTHHNELSEHYFSFEVDGRHLLEVTQTKRNEDKLFTDDVSEYLLYLPKRNEQVFANKITNLHPIADNILAVFTEHAIWNITASTLNDGAVAYSAPILSKIPAGCRDGDDVMTALDGQALLLATSRGIAALAPQDFVATADNIMTYLSDPIQDTYYRFYIDKVKNYLNDGYDPQIKMLSYRYWLLFYRYMDREILVFDTRTSAWWKWSTPYPIRQIVDDVHLHLILQIDYSADNTLDGVSYIWKDHEDTEYTGTVNADVELPSNVKSRKGYRDDIITNTLSGVYTVVHNNGYDPRRVKEYASPVIKWHFMSQKLHFNQINNYKAVKGITAVLKGEDKMQAVLSTKIYRDWYHPEQSDTVEISINELKTFTHRLNLMHTINFQYEFKNDTTLEEQIPLCLGSLSIKYEVKEGIR